MHLLLGRLSFLLCRLLRYLNRRAYTKSWLSQLLDPQMNKCMNEERRYLFIHFTSNIGSLTTTLTRFRASGDSIFYLIPQWFNEHVGTQTLTYRQTNRIEHFTLWSDYGTHKPLLQCGLLLRPTTLYTIWIPNYLIFQISHF